MLIFAGVRGSYLVDQFLYAFSHGIRSIACVRRGGKMEIELLAGEGDGVGVEVGEVCG